MPGKAARRLAAAASDERLGSYQGARVCSDVRRPGLVVAAPISLRLGVGYTFERPAFDDTGVGEDGVWTRHNVSAPLTVRLALSDDIGVSAGGGVHVLLAAGESRGDDTHEVEAHFADVTGFARLELDYRLTREPLDLRLALRYQRDLTPLFSEADVVLQAASVALQWVF